MNVALPALVAFLMLLPGFILRSRLKRAERTSLDYSPFGQIVTEGILWAVVAHLLWLVLSQVIFSRSLDPGLLLKLLASEPSGQAAATTAIGQEFSWISGYFISLFFASYAVPKLARILMSMYRLDRKGNRFNSLFRFHQAPWYYLLTGADFEEGNEPDFIVVSAIVDVAGEAILFTGILDEFFVDAEGKLDRVILQEVMRRPFSSDKTTTEPEGRQASGRFYPIDGEYFVLRYAEAITLNIEYIKLIESEHASEVSSPEA